MTMDTEATKMKARSTLKRDLVLLVVLVAVHEVCHRALAGGVVVSSLLSPAGARAAFTLLLGVFFVALRVALFVGAPAWAASQLVMALSRPYLYRE